MKVSVIVPVYNTEKYLIKCLDSLMNQTLKDIEIIIINDGSTDNSLEVCQNYIKSDPRFKIIDQKNQGLSSTRNVGLTVAQGDYIFFLDSDDWIKDDCLYKLYHAAVNNNYDIVVCNVVLFNGHKFENKKIWSVLGDRHILISELDKDIYIQPCWVWNKLYSKKFIDRYLLKFIHGLNYEDVPFLTQCLLHSPSIFYSEEYLYVYRIQRTESISNHVSLRSFDIYRSSKITEKILRSASHDSFLDKNFVAWKKWNYSWMYTHLPSYTHSFLIFLFLAQGQKLASEILSVLEMRVDIIKILGIPIFFKKYHNEKCTAYLFGIFPIYLAKRII